jgi:hypothetical protein
MDQEENNPQLTPEEIRILKNVIEREKALSWLSKSVKYIAGWVVIVFGAWALFSQKLTNWLITLLGQGPLQ